MAVKDKIQLATALKKTENKEKQSVFNKKVPNRENVITSMFTGILRLSLLNPALFPQTKKTST